MTKNPFVTTTSGLQPNAGISGEPEAITATSSTPQTIGTGSFSFQVPSQAAWAPGMVVSITSMADPANYMWGMVSSYSGTTLVVNVQGSGGSGADSDWQINLSGVGGGATGPSGPQGPAGAAGAPGGSVVPSIGSPTLTNNATTPNTQVDITYTNAVLVDPDTGLPSVCANATLTLDITTGHSVSTTDGMDGESPNPNSFLSVYIISNGSTISCLASNTSEIYGPTNSLPAGYTYIVYAGAVYVDGSGNLKRTLQKNSRTRYVVTPATNTASLPVLANGAAGSTTTPTWVSVDTTNAVPFTASIIEVMAHGDVGGTPVAVLVAPNNAYGSATSTNPPPIAVAAAAGASYGINEILLESTNIYWASGGTDGYLYCVGWDDMFVPA